MNIVKTVAKIRFGYHNAMLDVIDIANRLNILKDDKAWNAMIHHSVKCFDCLERMGYEIKLNK